MGYIVMYCSVHEQNAMYDVGELWVEVGWYAGVVNCLCRTPVGTRTQHTHITYITVVLRCQFYIVVRLLCCAPSLLVGVLYLFSDITQPPPFPKTKRRHWRRQPPRQQSGTDHDGPSQTLLPMRIDTRHQQI